MKRITVLKRKMKKKLTVRTLSFIMAAGLLLLVVPFVAIAAGREDPEPGKKGDFRLLRDFYAVTQITLEENMETAPVVTAENSNAASYQWQAYSTEREQYVDLSGMAAQQMELTEALAKQYDYGNGRSYFRCLATDAEGSILISDVLTVVLPVAPTEASQTEETSATISTIEIGEPTQPGETEPTEQTEPTKEPTVSTTSSTQPNDGNGETIGQVDGEPVEGQFLKPIDGEEEADSEPITGMFLRSMEQMRAVATTYTVVYHVQKPNYTGNDDDTSNYVIYKYETVNANSGDTVDLSTQMPGTDFDTFLHLNNNIGNVSETIAADGSTVFHLYYARQDFTFTIGRNGNTDIVLNTHRGSVTVNTANPYVFTVKFGESLVGLWPTNNMLTTRPTGNSKYLHYIRKETSSYSSDDDFYSAPTQLDAALVTELRKRLASDQTNFPMHFVFTNNKQYRYTANYFFQKEDGTWNSTPDYSISSKSISVFSNYPSYEGFNPASAPTSGNTRRVEYTRKQYTLRFDSNGGTSVPDATYYFEQTLVEPTEPTRSGYTFDAWYYDEGLTQAVNWGTDKMPANNTMLYAKWIPDVANFTLTIHYNNGNPDDTFTVASGTSLSSYEPGTDPTKEGYTFGGWYSDSSCTQAMNWSTTMPATGYDVYAKWNPHLTINKMDGSEPVVMHVETGTSLNTIFEINNPTRSGYTFDSWYTSSDYSDSSRVNLETATMPDEPMTVYAKWKYTVKFYLTYEYAQQNAPTDQVTKIEAVEHNSTINDQRTDYGQLSRLNNRSFNGRQHAFYKWYYDPSSPMQPSSENKTEFILGATQITDNMNIWAEWKPIYTVTFKTKNDSTASYRTVQAVEGTTVSQDSVPDPTLENETFFGWRYMDGTEEKTFSFGETTVVGDMEVYGYWRKNVRDLVIKNSGMYDEIFILSGSGITLKIAIRGEDSATVKHVPFGSYTVNPQKWDYRYHPLTAQSVTVSASEESEFDTPLSVDIGRGASRALNWLGSDKFRTFRPSMG